MLIDPQTGKVRLEGWVEGMDNRSDDHDIADSRLRDAVNVQILKSGKVKSRPGITPRMISSGAHSLFATDYFMVWATAASMCVSSDGVTKTLVLTDARLSSPISFVEVNGEIYWSNEKINGKINTLGAYEKWGIDIPATDVVLLGSTVEAGVLPRLYQVVCAFVTADGEESGSGNVVQVTAGDFPSISVFNIPQSADARVIATRLYITNIDGAIFYAQKDIPKGITSTVLQGFFANGKQLKNLFMGPPPPGQLLDYRAGKIYIASGSVVWITDPLNYGIVDMNVGFYMYSERVTLVKAVPDGFFVSSDKTYFITETSPKDVSQTLAFPHKAVEGAACSLPNTSDVMWFSDRGFVRGSTGGKVVLLTEDRLAVDFYDRGTMAYSHIAGHQAVTVMLQGGVPNPEINPDFVAAEATRRLELI